MNLELKRITRFLFRVVRVEIAEKEFKPLVHSKSRPKNFWYKCRKQTIRLCFYPNHQFIEGVEHRGPPGITIRTDMVGGGRTGPILEKYGEVPNETVPEASPNVNYMLDQIADIDERTIVRTQSSEVQLVLVEEEDNGPN